MKAEILVITTRDDLHALAIQRVLHRRAAPRCKIFECDHITQQHHLRGHITTRSGVGAIALADGDFVDLAEVQLIWWRRVRADQILPGELQNNSHEQLVHNECRGGLGGLLQTFFRGLWVSSPEATDKASSKIYQLNVARQCGFRIPETLITQSKSEVEAFVLQHRGQVIVKPIVGISGPMLLTRLLDDVSAMDERSFSLCPALYQEYIPGTQHIRLNCFGDRSYAATIESDLLDWRPDLRVPVRPYAVPRSLHRRVRATLDALDLRMGVVDLKVTPEGEVIWLEVNPQGQFMFLEALTGMPLAGYFADYLLSLVQDPSLAGPTAPSSKEPGAPGLLSSRGSVRHESAP